jgi:hypothetical protein
MPVDRLSTGCWLARPLSAFFPPFQGGKPCKKMEITCGYLVDIIAALALLKGQKG